MRASGGRLADAPRERPSPVQEEAAARVQQAPPVRPFSARRLSGSHADPARDPRGHAYKPLVDPSRKVPTRYPGPWLIKTPALKNCPVDWRLGALRAHLRPARVFGAGPPTWRFFDLGI